jgi:signal peptidase II
MHYGESIDIIGSFVKFTYVENPGMAFGIEVGDSKIFLSLFSIVAAVVILFYLYKVKDKSLPLRISLALIFAGAVGNLIDRVFYGVLFDYAPLMYGRVVDFVSVEFFDFTLFGHTYERWPIFNIADASVSIGIVMLFFISSGDKKKGKETDSAKEESKEDESFKTENSIDENSERIEKEKIIPEEKDERENNFGEENPDNDNRG